MEKGATSFSPEPELQIMFKNFGIPALAKRFSLLKMPNYCRTFIFWGILYSNKAS
jgi:hypothetical protein